MKRRLLIALAIALGALASSHDASADSSRKGLLVGGGLGLGVATLDADGADRRTRVGVATDITLGYGINDKLAAYLMSRIVWYSLEGDITFSETAGVGVSYFLSDGVPALFVSGGIGAALIVQPGSDVIENQSGLGGLVGVGYELRRHWLAEADLTIGAPGDFTSATGLVKLSYLHY